MSKFTESQLEQAFIELLSKEILLMMIESSIIAKEIAIILSISTSTIDKAITKLKTENIIQREGSTKVGYWKIITKK